MNPSQVGTLLAKGQPREALALALEGAQAHPQDFDWLHVLGAAQFHSGAAREAVATLRKAVDLAPQNAIAWNTLGAVLVELGEHKQAEQALEEAVRIKSDYKEALFNLAVSYRRSGRFDESKKVLWEINQRWRDFFPAHVEFVAALVDSGEAPKALAGWI